MRQKTRIFIYIIIAIAVVIMGTLAIMEKHKTSGEGSAQEHIDLGRIYLTELSYEKAVLEFTEAIEIEPLNPDAYLGLAETYVGMGDTEKAVEVLKDGYGKTGDERLRDMLEELIPTEVDKADVTIVSTISENTVEDDIRYKEEMETLYIPISLKYSKPNDDNIRNYALIQADNWDYNVTYDSNYNITSVSPYIPKYEHFKYLRMNISILYFNDTFEVYISESDGQDRQYKGTSQPLPALSYWDKNDNLLQYTETEYDEDFRVTKRNYYDGSGNFKNYERYVYTPEGNISEWYRKYGSNNEYLYYNCDFDKNNNISKETYYYENGEAYNVSSYEYNAAQNLIRRTDNLGDAELVREYDASGNLIRESHDSGTFYYENSFKYDLNNNVIEETYKTDDVYYKYLYDSNGNKINDIIYDDDGSISSETQYKYDSNNNRIWLYRKYSIGTYEEVYTYDSNGNLIKEKLINTYEDGETYEHTKVYSYTYDSNGRIIEEMTKGEENNQIINVTKYTYDQYGNLLKESQYNSSGEEYNSVSYEYIKIKLSKSFTDRCMKQ